MTLRKANPMTPAASAAIACAIKTTRRYEQADKAQYTAVGERITLLRLERNMKARTLADKAGIAVNTLGRMVWRNEGVSPKLFQIELVAQALGVEAWELFMDAPLKDDWSDPVEPADGPDDRRDEPATPRDARRVGR